MSYLSDETFKLLLENIPRRSNRPIFQRLTDEPSIDEVGNGPVFKGTTDKPYRPTMKVRGQLYVRIGGNSGLEEEDKPVWKVAEHAAAFLLQHPDEEPGVINEVPDLLGETIRIATKCYEKSFGPDRKHFVPEVVRGLQLTKGLNRGIRVSRNGESISGTPQRFVLPLPLCSIAPFAPYTLEICVNSGVEDLPVVYIQVSADEWYRGPAGVEFLP